MDPEALFQEMTEQRELIRPYGGDAALVGQQALAEGKQVLLEGQLGTLKDPDFGIYPMVTSSHTLAAYGAVGVGVSPREIRDIVCGTKAYSSAVGAGDFVTELFGDEAEELRRRGGDKGEYGATTGRPRRVGWFDAVATEYGCRMQGATEAVLTAIDVLGYLDEIKVCTGYEIDGQVVTTFPVTRLLDKAKPVYTTLPGWKCDIRGLQGLCRPARRGQGLCGLYRREDRRAHQNVSTGPRREDMTYRK